MWASQPSGSTFNFHRKPRTPQGVSTRRRSKPLRWTECVICEQRVPSKGYWKHLRSHNGDSNTCVACTRPFDSHQNLQNHYKSPHGWFCRRSLRIELDQSKTPRARFHRHRRRQSRRSSRRPSQCPSSVELRPKSKPLRTQVVSFATPTRHLGPSAANISSRSMVVATDVNHVNAPFIESGISITITRAGMDGSVSWICESNMVKLCRQQPRAPSLTLLQMWPRSPVRLPAPVRRES